LLWSAPRESRMRCTHNTLLGRKGSRTRPSHFSHMKSKSVTFLSSACYVLGAGPAFEPRRIALDPGACGGATFRYAAEGWGLVQLYLSAPRAGRLENSHTNHNSKARAELWEPIRGVEPGSAAWDFPRITAFSSRLNRQIKKRGVAKIGSRVVLQAHSSSGRAGCHWRRTCPDSTFYR
jgi:hypothetical protein